MLVACIAWCALPASAAADWYFTPFIGWDFKVSTTLPDLDYLDCDNTQGCETQGRRKTTFGGAVAFIKGFVGLEAEYAFAPAFFRNPNTSPPLVAGSHLQTFTGSLVVTTPLAWTRESLRPYIVVGAGWMNAEAEFISNAGGPSRFIIHEDRPALTVGGGAIGMLGNRTGLRFDLRRTSFLHGQTAPGSFIGTELALWRGTVGVTLRY